ncbi:MAG: S-layer homology domain-containing protein, partial [Ruminococcaceae bacterium]|nr:S-layer homology domain-containing protein [Oscillospiraceae bacterium]
IAVIGKGSTQRVPAEPKSYAAPVISEMKVVPPGEYETEAHVYFELDTPDSVWDAEIYYAMNDEWGMDELDAQINVNSGGWQDVYVGNSHWPLYEGDRVTSTTAAITEKSHVQLRVRYGGPLGYSDWSNVLSVNAPDFDASVWAQEELARADELGLIPDCLEGEDLRQDITRAEFAAVAVKVYEALSGTAAIPAVINPFTDTTDIEVLKAYNVGITNGTGDGTTFSPNALLNREQAATMLARVFKKVTMPGWTLATDGQYPLSYTKPAAFKDDGDISGWAKDFVYFMAANGIIQGNAGKFMPKAVTPEQEAAGYAQATREQALLIAVRMVENLGK